MQCNNCGTISDGTTKYCSNCGTAIETPPAPPPPPSYNPQMPPQPQMYHGPAGPGPGHGTGSFVERLHRYGGSNRFFAGALLFTLGHVLNVIFTISTLPFSLGIWSLIGLAYTSLPIIALWLIYAASKAPRLPEKTFPALTLVKVHTIIGLVLVCLVAAIILIAVIILAIVGATTEPALIVVAIVMGVISLGIFALFIVFYYVALLRVLSSIRAGLYNNVLKPLKGVTPLMVMVIIFAVFGFIGALISFTVPALFDTFMDQLMVELAAELGPEFMDMWGPAAIVNVGVGFISFVLTISTHVGALLCMSVLSGFNRSLKYGEHRLTDPMSQY